MPNIGRIVDSIVKDDPNHLAVKAKVGDGREVFAYSEDTLRLIMGFTFECNGCSNCCYKSKTDPCGELSDKKCKIYGKERPLLCSTYPFRVETSQIRIGEKSGLLGRHLGQRVEKDGQLVFGFALYDGFSLVIEDSCEGWLQGSVMIKDIGRRVVEDIKTKDPAFILPPYAKNDANLEMFGRDRLKRLKEEFSSDDVDIGGLFCDPTAGDAPPASYAVGKKFGRKDVQTQNPPAQAKERLSVMDFMPGVMIRPEDFGTYSGARMVKKDKKQ